MDQAQARIAVFSWLEKMTIFDDVLSWHVLQEGFEFQGSRITLIGQQGIWKPKVFERIPISIRTSSRGIYDDGLTEDGFFRYKYRGTDPSHRDNVGLREAMSTKTPLVFFMGLVPGKYLAIWPVFIVDDSPRDLSFVVAADDKQVTNRLVAAVDDTTEWTSGLRDESQNPRRQYVTSTVRTRLHQRSFREKVLDAYRRQCSFCHLRHEELLDAAHITPDADLLGEPIVTNGLALCKIHHAAFDRNFVGVSPDLLINVREDLLRETDGPMLRHGIQELHGQRLILPTKKALWPDRDRLRDRYKDFVQAM